MAVEREQPAVCRCLNNLSKWLQLLLGVLGGFVIWWLWLESVFDQQQQVAVLLCWIFDNHCAKLGSKTDYVTERYKTAEFSCTPSDKDFWLEFKLKADGRFLCSATTKQESNVATLDSQQNLQPSPQVCTPVSERTSSPASGKVSESYILGN